MKDFYDMATLKAIQVTMNKRGTTLPDRIAAFDSSFSKSKQTQGTAFCKRLHLDHTPADLAEVVADIQSFLDPVIRDIR